MRRIAAPPVALLVLVAALLVQAPPVAVAERSALEQRAGDIVREVLATRPAQGTVPGIMVVRRDGRLAARNPRLAMRPASLQKLATTATALMRFGPEHRFTTRVLVTAPREDGSVGRLVLVGGGDPTLATAGYRKRWLLRRAGMAADERMFPSGSPTIAQVARQIQQAGVTHIRGNLLADDSLFDQVRTQKGWRSSYLDRSTGGPHVGYISALAINQGYSNLDRTRVARQPALFAAERLRAALESRGITVEGKVVLRAAPESAREVTSVSSPPLAEIVGWINRWSANHPAELLLKGLGASFRGDGSTAGGRRVIRATLRNAGVSVDDLRIEDGSGLSLANRMTPRTITGILRWARYSSTPAARAMRASFPVACRPGTLLRRMCETRADGNLRGKTGLVSGTRAMAGWVRGTDGVWTVYVALFNRADSPGSLTSTLDLLGRRLSRLG